MRTNAKPTKKNTRVALKALKHDEATRKNLPTIENEGLVSDAIKQERKVDYPRQSASLYPRKIEADPQLVWRGKDEEDDDGDLIVKALPIYVHEHITTQHIIHALMEDSDSRSDAPEFFERDFNGLTEDQRLRYYEFDGHWTNRLILGNSLAVMASLSEKEGLRGLVQTIFMDPPYGIDFASNWQVATGEKTVQNGKESEISTEPEQLQAFRDTWKDGVHSYLSHLRDRLSAAHTLLDATGSLFLQISAKNEHLVRSVLDEVFGADNFCSLITFRKKTMPLGARLLESISDYIIWHAKDKERVKFRPLFDFKDVTGDSHWDRYELPDGSRHKMTREQIEGKEPLPEGADPYQLISMAPAGFNASNVFDFDIKDKTYTLKPGKSWNTNLVGMRRLGLADRLEPYSDGETLRYVLKLSDYPVSKRTNLWADVGAPSDKVYVVQTNNQVVQRCLLMTSDPGDLVLDPTCGGGTTAYVAEQWARRWITIDTSRVSLALTRARLMSAKYPYYLLADSHEGRKREAQASGIATPADLAPPRGDVSKGLVYQRVKHFSREDITNNAAIDVADGNKEVERILLRTAPIEYLVDRPYPEKYSVRVAGPFTVESLAPVEASPLQRNGSMRGDNEQGDFIELILDNIKSSGIVNGEKGGRTRFKSIQAFPGEYINAVGITEDDHRFGIAIGPKEGTISMAYMRAAGREALNGAIVKTLAVCGFAFDDSAQTHPMGDLLVLKVRMNQDLQFAELLKKSRGATLFRVYGEPDVEIKSKNSRYTVEVNGMDVYDPTKREIRSAGTDKISAWFLDTNYDGERFIVRHAYFLGDNTVFDSLKRALKGEIDETGWRSIYSRISRPFPKPTTGRVAVKVITVYGDESIVILRA